MIEIQKKETKMEEIFVLEDLILEIVHKLNNHLTPVIGYAQLLLPKMIQPNEKIYLEKIIEEAQQTSRIIKDLVNLVKKRNLEKGVVEINDL